MPLSRGHAAPSFEPVREAFERKLTEREEVGAACCAYVRGEPVVDLWGGSADGDAGRRWQENTMVLVFSSTKGMTAACVHLLLERGALELDSGGRRLARVRGGGPGTAPSTGVNRCYAGKARAALGDPDASVLQEDETRGSPSGRRQARLRRVQ